MFFAHSDYKQSGNLMSESFKTISLLENIQTIEIIQILNNQRIEELKYESTNHYTLIGFWNVPHFARKKNFLKKCYVITCQSSSKKATVCLANIPIARWRCIDPIPISQTSAYHISKYSASKFSTVRQYGIFSTARIHYCLHTLSKIVEACSS